MKTLLICSVFLLAGCNLWHRTTQVTVSPTPGPISIKADAVSDSRDSKAAAAVTAANVGVEVVETSRAKDVILAEHKIALANLPEPDPKDLAIALARANEALSGDLKKATISQHEALVDAAQSKVDLKNLEIKAAKELSDQCTQYESAIKRLKDDADSRVAEAQAETKRQLGYIFFGAALIGLGLGVASMTFASALPMVGPKLTIGCFIFAGLSSGLGVLLIRALDSEWIPRLMITLGVLVVVLVVLAFVNHWHEKQTPASTPVKS